MIIQAAGQPANVPCDKCQKGKGPFQGCILIPITAPLGVRQSILACANCFYKCNQTYCNLKPWSLKTYPELTGQLSSQGTPSTVQPDTPQPVEIEKQSETRCTGSELRESVTVSLPVSGPSRSASPTRPESAPNDGREIVQRDPSPNLATDLDAGDLLNHSLNGVGLLPNGYESTFNPAQMLEMETWEIAPGRICNEQGDTIESTCLRIPHDVRVAN